jgi:hypothetical protein
MARCDFLLPYGSGTVIGKLANDTVTVGGLALPADATPFGEVIAEPGQAFNDGFFNGILGLAYPIIALPLESFLPGPFDVMIKEKLLPEDIFSVYLSSTWNDSTSAGELVEWDARWRESLPCAHTTTTRLHYCNALQ